MVLLALGFTTQKAADYRIYISAGRVMIDDHGNPYEDMIETEPDGMVTAHNKYLYAPVFGMALYPISLLPKPVYLFLWLFFNAFLFYKSMILFRSFFHPLKTDNRLFIMVSAICLLFTVRLFGQNLELGQTTILLVFLSVYALHLSHEQRYWLAGLMLAIATITKIMPIVLIAYFVYRKDFKTSIYSLLFTGLLVLLPSLIVGHEYNVFLIKEWFNSINPTNEKYLLETKTGIYNLSAFIFAYFTEMPDERVVGDRNLLTLSYETATIITQVVRALMTLFTLYFIKSMPFQKASSREQSFWEFGYILLAFPLIFPAQNKYSFYFIIPAVFMLSCYLVTQYRNGGGFKGISWKLLVPMALFFILVNLTSSNIIGKQWYDQTQFYKIITFGIIALLIAYVQLRPKAVKESLKQYLNE